MPGPITRVLVVGVVGLGGTPRIEELEGADLLELDAPPGTDPAAVTETAAALAKLASVPIVTNPAEVAAGGAVATANTPAGVAVAILNGSRVIRTNDVRGARRVVDVLAAVMGAG